MSYQHSPAANTKSRKLREMRKLVILGSFCGNEVLNTSNISSRLGITWVMAKALLEELIAEQKLIGSIETGYSLPVVPKLEVKAPVSTSWFRRTFSRRTATV